jgi:rubrerythrin
MDWATFLRIMRIDEEGAQAKYRAAAEMTDDPRVREVLERLAYEEEVHAGLLMKEEERLKGR